jgi:hypothetical protein
MSSPSLPRAVLTLTLTLTLLAHLPALAGFPIPDHVLYGTIAVGNRAITRVNSDVAIEARRSPNGPVIASYRMGTLPRLGEFFYELRLELEEAPAESPRAFLIGQSVLLTVRNTRGVQFQVTHVLADSGVAQRLDFGTSVDTQNDGVPDGWQLTNLGSTSSNLRSDSDDDHANDAAEYTAGTAPRDGSDTFRLGLQRDGTDLLVTLRALATAGTGYEGRQRFYALEVASDPVAGPWQAVENHSRIPGNNQLLTYRQPTGSEGPLFYRARVWLEGP